ncbi:Non-canonical poly(A) RNA polymerase PAPD5 [Senna tora]|uniref:polynucleotide adenylyltransferase n=1 Tax=Senna tora TaxID=362788 RepID=A0A834WJ32_9FABA|nr:Non-canonical poly(A) RNA polymerase PAPD5 [Senna tora]KAF7822723.1 Non-canonical poly(A) RNA polymerase PAPD5 [Senna tora]
MEDEHLDNPKTIVYETLSPLYLSTANQSPVSDELEPYTVFRNEISLSTLQCASPETAAPDFFSLHVGTGDVTERDSVSQGLTEPVAATEPKTPVLVSEPKLEGSWFRGNCKFRSPMLQLHKEIVDFCEFLSPTPEEKAARDTAIESVFGVIKHIWPHCQVEVFGSFRTGLYLPTSDIDVVILKAGLPNPQLGLNALSRALSQRSMAKNIIVIGKARVPIIKFVEKRSGVSFDISFDVDNGPKAADYIQEAVTKWPQLRPLCLILKVFLQQRELNEVYSGGIGSYALLTMLMAMLRNLRESQASAEHNLGVLLVQFFDFYGRKLNTADVGVSCSGMGTFFLKSKKGFLNKGRPNLLAIEDPQAPENDIGKNSFNYFQIRSAFSMAFTTLTNPKIILSLGPNKSILGTIIRPDPILLERKGGSNGEVTFNSLLPGAGEPLQVQYGDQDMLCNWRFDDEEEPLPRGIDGIGDESSSRKKRRSPFRENPRKKPKENGDLGMVRNEENVSGKENGLKKKNRRKPE